MDLQTAPLVPAAPAGLESYRLRFTGDGGVYFGVWLVNLLLMIVTVGLYTPFARRRTLSYFYANSLVAGSPLEFTGGIKRMFLGFLMFFGLYLAYTIASHTEQDLAAAVLAFGWAGLMPWLWASAVRFRSANTRWRGIRGHFHATARQTYAASWPLLGLLGVGGGLGLLAGQLDKGGWPAWLVGGVAAFLAMLLLIRLEFNYGRLRVLRTSFGGHPGRWKAPFGEFLRFSGAAFGLFVAIIAGLVALFAAAVFLGGLSLSMLKVSEATRGAAFVFLIIAAIVASFFVFYLAAGPALAYREARKFALVWNTVGLGQVARFRCDLRPGPFIRLRVKNMLLTLVTAGFYRPFAVTSEYRMKLQSVTLHVKGGLDQLAGQMVQQQGAFADAIADAVGFDAVG